MSKMCFKIGVQPYLIRQKERVLLFILASTGFFNSSPVNQSIDAQLGQRAHEPRARLRERGRGLARNVLAVASEVVAQNALQHARLIATGSQPPWLLTQMHALASDDVAFAPHGPVLLCGGPPERVHALEVAKDGDGAVARLAQLCN